ncbi:hypothetical protein [Sphingobacterium sp. WOUb80]
MRFKLFLSAHTLALILIGSGNGFAQTKEYEHRDWMMCQSG